MLRNILRKNQFLKKMNTLLELYSYSHNTESTYQELLALEPLIRTKGERALFDLNRASLLYVKRKVLESADILLDIPPLNPQYDAQCAQLKTKIMEAMRKPIPGMVVMGELSSSIKDWICSSTSAISASSSRMSRIVCWSSRDLAGIWEPIEFLAASRIAIAISRL